MVGTKKFWQTVEQDILNEDIYIKNLIAMVNKNKAFKKQISLVLDDVVNYLILAKEKIDYDVVILGEKQEYKLEIKHDKWIEGWIPTCYRDNCVNKKKCYGCQYRKATGNMVVELISNVKINNLGWFFKYNPDFYWYIGAYNVYMFKSEDFKNYIKEKILKNNSIEDIKNKSTINGYRIVKGEWNGNYNVRNLLIPIEELSKKINIVQIPLLLLREG